MTTTLTVSAAPIQPFAIGGNALQIGPINMQEIVGSQVPNHSLARIRPGICSPRRAPWGIRTCSGCEGRLAFM
jgi:hypothetical protein